MNVKRNWRETGIYWILCIISLGAIWFLRITITVAIRMAFENYGENKKKINEVSCCGNIHTLLKDASLDCTCPSLGLVTIHTCGK